VVFTPLLIWDEQKDGVAFSGVPVYIASFFVGLAYENEN
jgi:hypothetical protein